MRRGACLGAFALVAGLAGCLGWAMAQSAESESTLDANNCWACGCLINHAAFATPGRR